MDPVIRPQQATDGDAVTGLLALAFADEPEVVGLEVALRGRPDSHGYVAEVDGRVVGHVQLTRGWIDAAPRLVEVLVLGPLAVLPECHRQGIGRALCAHAVREAEALGAPAVFLEGSPAYYSRLGWRPAAELGVTPPSVRIPAPAFQAVRLPGWDDAMGGALVYADTFWAHDCVGLRGELLAEVRQALGA